MIVTDLHVHGRFARGTSRNMDLPSLAKFGKLKGINLMGVGDIFHEQWVADAKKVLRGGELDGMHFLPAGEVSTIWNDGASRKVHHVVMLPSLDDALEFRATIEKQGYWGDGRPMIRMSAEEFTQRLFDFSREALIFPAHIWTPWFGVYGSKSGFNRLAEAYGSMTPKITAIETGLSSDPEMNWAVSDLDARPGRAGGRAILSFSDLHSFWPHRIGRELTALDAEPTYESVTEAIRRNRVSYTVEVDPSYGKYHFDGHRDCNVSMSPEDAEKHHNRCPSCGRPLTKGVMHRVNELADRPLGTKPANAKPFFKVLPLTEVFAYVNGGQPGSKTNLKAYFKAVESAGTELKILLELTEKELDELLGEAATRLIMRMRNNQLHVVPGYDGVYGEIGEGQSEKKFTTLDEFS